MELNNITGRIKKIKFADGTEYPILDSNAVSDIEVTKTTGETDDNNKYPYEQVISNFKNGTNSSVALIKATQTTLGSKKKITLDFQGQKIEFYVTNYDEINLDPPILYILTNLKKDGFFTEQNAYNKSITTLPYNKTKTITLNEEYLHIAIPKKTYYGISNIMTSNQLPLTLLDDFEKCSQSVSFTFRNKSVIVDIYKLLPTIALDMSLTFTFTLNNN